MTIEFLRPYVLIGIPIVIGLLILSLRFLHVRSKSQKISYIIVRALVITLLLMALSGLSIKLKGNNTATIFLIDVSDSVKDSRADMISFINDAIKEKEKNDSVAIVAFGDDIAIEQFLSETASFSELQTRVVKSSTNIEKAIQTGISLIPDGYAGRIVLLTDGTENSGEMKNTVPSIISTKTVLEVKKYKTVSSDEAYISNLVVPQEVGLGEKFVITVEITSNVASDATVSLYAGRTFKTRKTLALQPGINTFVFEDTQTEEGLKTYRVVLEAEKDTLSVNNEYLAYTDIARQKPILVVEGKLNESREFTKLLDSLNQEYDVVQPLAVPDSVSELNDYSAVVFVDVFASDLRAGFLDALEIYVRDFAGGFVATGGTNTYLAGGYKDTTLEKVLPVNMDPDGKNEIPDVSVMLVIDHSGSMSGENLKLAKKSAIAAVETLRSQDSIGVISFDDTFSRVVKLNKLSDSSDVISAINSIPEGGGTSIYPALEAAIQDSAKYNSSIKHIILLTDGEDGYEYNHYTKILNYANDNNITISTVSIGTGCNYQLLDLIAQAGSGRSYHTDEKTDIPRIFTQEIYLSINSVIVNRAFYPTVVASGSLLTGVGTSGYPQLKGFVATSIKQNALEYLRTDSGEPLLSSMQYGLGKTVAWTTDVTNKWTGNYAGWSEYQRMWNNILQYVTVIDKVEGAYANVKQNGTTASIEYITENYDTSSSIVATVADDKGNTKDFKLDPTSPGKFAGDFEMSENGVYSINLKQYNQDTLVGSLNTAAIMQYSLEYRFYDTQTTFDEFINSIGAKMIETPSEVFAEALDLVRQQKDFSSVLLIIALVLFMFDVFIRRFRINPFKNLSKLPAKFKQPVAADQHQPLTAGKNQTTSKDRVVATSNNQSEAAFNNQPVEPSNGPEVKTSAPKAEKTEAPKSQTGSKNNDRLDTQALLKNLNRK